MIFDARLAIATLAVFLTAAFCAWQLSATAEKTQNNEKIKTLSQQVTSVRAQVETQLEKTANDLTALIQTQIASPEATPEFTRSGFLALAVLSSTSNQPWAIEWTKSKNDVFAKTFLDSQVTYWALDRLKGDDMQLLRLETPDRRVYFVLTLQIRFKSSTGEEVKVAAGILPSAFFSGVTDTVKGTTDELMVVDAGGYSYAYPDQQYVGSKMDPHPLVKTLMKSPSSTEFRPTRSLSGARAIGGYEKLKNANLYVLISSPTQSRSKAAIEAFLQVGIITLAVALLSALCIALINQRENVKIQTLDTRLKVLDQRTHRPEEVKSFASDKDRLAAMRDLAFSVVQYLRAPISAMLGQAQIGQTKTDMTTAKDSFVHIEKAARQSRDFLEGLAKINGFERLDTRPIAVENVLQQSLNHVRAQLEKSGIRIEENYKTTATAELAMSEFRMSLQHLLLFFGERLSLINTAKRLNVDIEQVGSLLRLRISDSAATPSAEQLRRLFEPFATAGLHLATLRALVETFRGTVRAERNEPQGLKIEIDLPQWLGQKETATVVATSPSKVVTPPPVIVTPSVVHAPATETIDTTILGKALDERTESSVNLPPTPTETDVTVKDELSAAEEISVVIRKPIIKLDNT